MDGAAVAGREELGRSDRDADDLERDGRTLGASDPALSAQDELGLDRGERVERDLVADHQTTGLSDERGDRHLRGLYRGPTLEEPSRVQLVEQDTVRAHERRHPRHLGPFGGVLLG